jgi:hypothetical protein
MARQQRQTHYTKNFVLCNSVLEPVQGMTDAIWDACGQHVNPLTEYVWTEKSVEGTFAGSLSSGFLQNSELVGYVWLRPGPALHALIRNNDNGNVGLFRVDPNRGRPYEVLRDIASLGHVCKVARAQQAMTKRRSSNTPTMPARAADPDPTLHHAIWQAEFWSVQTN